MEQCSFKPKTNVSKKRPGENLKQTPKSKSKSKSESKFNSFVELSQLPVSDFNTSAEPKIKS